MEPQYKFKLKTYIYYLFIEPWTDKISFPNFRTLAWVFILIAVFFRLRELLIISIVFGVLVYLIQEFKSGRHIYWYRQRKFKEQREALKKVREERRNKQENGNNPEGLN